MHANGGILYLSYTVWLYRADSPGTGIQPRIKVIPTLIEELSSKARPISAMP